MRFSPRHCVRGGFSDRTTPSMQPYQRGEASAPAQWIRPMGKAIRAARTTGDDLSGDPDRAGNDRTFGQVRFP
ncbi:hypothetical protein GCM10029978_105460 [Actinoallomurus acanthiterrae]